MSQDDTPSLADRMMAARLAAGLRPDKRPATREEILRQRAIKDEAKPGTDEHAMREAKLAEIEDRRPRHSLRSSDPFRYPPCFSFQAH